MNEEQEFMDELLAEAELKELSWSDGYFDLLLLQIQQLTEQIAHNFSEAEKEITVINDWALRKNHALKVKVEFIEKKLEAFIREREVKTIELAHGTLKIRKKPDKVEVKDMDLFLKNATPELLTVIPEQVRPDMAMIKNYIKTHYNSLPGVVLIPGKEEFSYKLNNSKKEIDDNGRETEVRPATEQTLQSRIAV